MSGLDVTRPLSDNQFEQLYHAVLRSARFGNKPYSCVMFRD
ncbi:hypothetical protein ABKW02_24430, partial [Enterobacter cloacae]